MLYDQYWFLLLPFVNLDYLIFLGIHKSNHKWNNPCSSNYLPIWLSMFQYICPCPYLMEITLAPSIYIYSKAHIHTYSQTCYCSVSHIAVQQRLVMPEWTLTVSNSGMVYYNYNEPFGLNKQSVIQGNYKDQRPAPIKTLAPIKTFGSATLTFLHTFNLKPLNILQWWRIYEPFGLIIINWLILLFQSYVALFFLFT